MTKLKFMTPTWTIDKVFFNRKISFFKKFIFNQPVVIWLFLKVKKSSFLVYDAFIKGLKIVIN